MSTCNGQVITHARSLWSGGRSRRRESVRPARVAGQRPAGLFLETAQSVPDGIRMAEQDRSGAVGGAARVQPGTEGAEQQGAVTPGHLIERAEGGA